MNFDETWTTGMVVSPANMVKVSHEKGKTRLFLIDGYILVHLLIDASVVYLFYMMQSIK